MQRLTPPIAPQNGLTSFPTKMSVGLAEVIVTGLVAVKSIGDPTATAAQATGVAGHVMDEENVAPDKGWQHLPPEGGKPRKLSAGDPDRVAMPGEQPEEERPPEEHAPRPQRRAPRGPKHFLAVETRTRRVAARGEGALCYS